MAIGDAVLGLRSLSVLLDGTSLADQFDAVQARVKHAISEQSSTASILALGDVYPRLRPPADADRLSWFEPVAQGRLLECVVLDEAETVRYLDPIQVVGFGVGVQGVRQRSRLNLLALRADFVSHPEDSRIQRCRMGDGHDAARLLVAGNLLSDMDKILCCVPDRDTLFCANLFRDDIQGVARKMRELAVRRATRAAYPLSAECFVVAGESIQHIPFRKGSLESSFMGL
jgi:hypothetical protein